jgi:glucose dehydrogenase
MYITVGNPAPDLDGGQRAGDNLFTESIVALDAKTGTRKWHFQEVHHDIWDYDVFSPNILFDVQMNGTTVKGLGQAGKTGWVYLLDRTTGKPMVVRLVQPENQPDVRVRYPSAPDLDGQTRAEPAWHTATGQRVRHATWR